MPSNAMKISQLEALLAELRVQNGDLDVILAVSDLGAAVAVDGRNVTVLSKLPWQQLPGPAVVIGLWSDARGALQPTPGAQYQVGDRSDDRWNYNRDAAPEGVELPVWRRHTGEDVGIRHGERWLVRNGTDMWIECAPAGILGWRDA